MSTRAGVVLGTLSVLAAVVVAALLRLAILPFGSYEWAWEVRTLPCSWGTAAVLALLGALLLAVLVFEWVRAPREPSRRTCTWLLLALLPVALLIEGGILLNDPLYPASAPVVVLSDVATGYYGVAARTPEIRTILSGEASQSHKDSLPDRVRTHPPGPILLMWAVRQLALAHADLLARLEAFLVRTYDLSAADLISLSRVATTWQLSTADALVACLISWLLTVLSVLIFLPVYGLGAVLGNRRVGLAAAALSLSLPALWCFLPGIDGVGAVIALTALWLWAMALRNGDWWRYALAGLGFAVALFWSYGYLALGLVALFLGWSSRESRPANLPAGLVYTVAAWALFYGLLDACFGFNLWRALPAALGTQRMIMLREHRAYLTWLALNPYALLVFLGPALWGGMIWAWFSRGVQHGFLARATQGTLLTVLLLLLMGSTRGEVERIWVFLMPLLLLPFAALLTRLPKPLSLWLPVALLIAQIAFAIFLSTNFLLVSAA